MSATDSPASAKKVVIHLRATGDAPILKQAKFKIAETDKFAKVIDFLRRQLHRDSLFVYINSAFSPNPDELVMDLYSNFGFDGKLVGQLCLFNGVGLSIGICRHMAIDNERIKFSCPVYTLEHGT